MPRTWFLQCWINETQEVIIGKPFEINHPDYSWIIRGEWALISEK